MGRRSLKTCAEPSCPELVDQGRCDDHRREADARRGTRQQRGYDAAHMRERARWKPIVEAGTAACAKCGLPIPAAGPWDLGHTDDRRTWTGPEHVACNRGHRARGVQ